MGDILFKCLECGEQLAVGVEDIGLAGNCPECDKPIQIPNASFEIQCLDCKESFKIAENLRNQQITCPRCEKQILVFNGSTETKKKLTLRRDVTAQPHNNIPPPPVEKKCSECGEALTAGAILCVKCGFNLTTSEKLKISQDSKRYSYSPWVIAFVVLILLLVIAGGSFFFLKQGSLERTLSEAANYAQQNPKDFDAAIKRFQAVANEAWKFHLKSIYSKAVEQIRAIGESKRAEEAKLAGERMRQREALASTSKPSPAGISAQKAAEGTPISVALQASRTSNAPPLEVAPVLPPSVPLPIIPTPTLQDIEETKKDVIVFLETKGLSGVKYEAVKITRVTPADVEITYKAGVATIPIGKLPFDLQVKLGFNPTAASQYRITEQQQLKEAANRREEQRRSTEQMASAITINGTVTQVVGDGLFLDGNKLIVGHPRQRQVVEGDRLQFKAWRDGVYSYVTVGEYQRTIEKWRYAGSAQIEQATSQNQNQKMVCPICGGSGRIVNFKGSPGTKCPNCGGTGYVSR